MIAYKTFDESFDQFSKIDLPENPTYLDAFNALKSLCDDSDVIVLASAGCKILKPIDTYISKLLESDCQVGGVLNNILMQTFSRIENDTIPDNFNIISFNFVLINCSEFKKLEIPLDVEFTVETSLSTQLELVLATILTKCYIFPKLYLDSESLPNTLDFVNCHVAKFMPLNPVNISYMSDVLLDNIYTEEQLTQKRIQIPLNCLILDIKQRIIKALVGDESCEIELI
jgi:hypothetical protein